METFLFKFSACLLVFWLVYILILERQKIHFFKRFYLLFSVVTALIIPTLTITHYVEPVITDFEILSNYIPVESSFIEAPIVEPPFWNLETVLWLIYGIGVLLFSIRFIVNLLGMYHRIRSNEKVQKRTFTYVLLKQNLIPHTFFKYIFFNRLKFEENKIPNEVVLHEETHAKQLHSVDILLAELLQIVFWFHPLIYILKHHIKLNHEFLADQAVLKQGADTKVYQNILLKFSSSTSDYALSSAINYSSIKKRFTVMKTETSKIRIWTSGLLLLPIIAILFYSFAERVEVVKPETDAVESLTIDLKEAEKSKIQYVGENIIEIYLNQYKKYETLRTKAPHYIYKSNDEQNEMEELFSNLGGIYFRMSKENKVKVERPISPIKPYVIITLNGKTYYKKYSELTSEEKATLPPPPPPPISKNATPIQKKKMQQAIDDYEEKHKRKVYTATNVRTGEYISLIADEEIYEPNQNPKTITVLINRKNDFLINDERGSFESLEKLLKELPKTQNYKVDFRTDRETSSKLIKTVLSLFKKYKNLIVEHDRNNPESQQKATKKQIAEYNVWAMKKNLSDNKIIMKNDLKKFKHIYNIMSDEQKKTSEAFPQIPPPPPPANVPLYKNGMKKTLNEIIEETPKGAESGYEMLENGETHYFTIYNGKKTYYNSNGYITDYKGNVLPPPPPAPEAPRAKKSEGEVPPSPPIVSVKFNSEKQVPPPPPPPPKSAHEFVRSLKKDDITYYFEDKKVSYEKVLKITKDYPNISMQSDIQNNKGYVKFWSKE